MPKTYRDTDDPIRALGDALAFSSRDWTKDTCDAWLYGIILGWDEEDNGVESAMDSIAGRHGWDAHDVARLRRLRSAFRQLTEISAERDRLRETAGTVADHLCLKPIGHEVSDEH